MKCPSDATSIELAQRGMQVLAVGKHRAHDAHTTLAAGGINATLGTMDPADSCQQHAADTLRESYFLADPAIVEVVARGAAQGIEDLERWGMPFARERDGRISQCFFGAHTYRGTAYAGEYTGLELQRTLLRRARELQGPSSTPCTSRGYSKRVGASLAPTDSTSLTANPS